MADAEVVLDNVTKRFAAASRQEPKHAALDGVSLEVARGELVVVVGPSGCGKSTTLRMIAGLDEPDSGVVAIAGKSMRGVAPQDRDLAMVFQGYALYPQMTVKEILEFPLKMRGASREERAKRAHEAAEMLRIEKFLERRPGELSGGERQRVAMGRAIVRKPRVFLFDEPLSNLDAALRGDIRLEIGALVRRLGATALYVTHDHVEAMTLADRIAVMRAGKLLQLASPREIYERPATSFVGTFLGSPRMNILPAKVDGDAVACGAFRLARPLVTPHVPSDLEVGVRPEDVRLVSENEKHGVACEVVAVEPLGAETHLVVRAGEHAVRVRCAGFDGPKRGESVRVAIDEARAHFFDPAKGGARIDAR
jgi:multiple sugar transport system ATP-binding protein